MVEARPREIADLLVRSLRSPLVYVVDPAMRWFGELPVVEPGVLLERVADRPEALDLLDVDPLVHLVLAGDPTSQQAWLETALAFLDGGQWEPALTMACNALHVGATGADVTPALHFLEELYAALGWPVHSAWMSAEAERLRRRSAPAK